MIGDIFDNIDNILFKMMSQVLKFDFFVCGNVQKLDELFLILGT